MPHIWADRVLDTSTSTGTGAFTVVAAPPSSYRTFSAVCATGDTFFGAIEHTAANEWEVGFYTYSAANQITRTEIIASSNANSAVNFSAGTKRVFITTPAAISQLVAAQNILINGDFQINQRVFGGGSLSAGAYGFDRWKAATGGANCSISGFTLTLTSGELEQIVEPSLWRVSSFASQVVTVSVESPSQALTVTFGSQSGSIPAGTGRQAVRLTLGSGDTGNLAFRIRRTSAGSVTFARVKLELGPVATPWKPRTLPEEFILCCRYFWRRYRQTAGSFDVIAMLSQFASTQAWGGEMKLPATMRAVPTVTFSDVAHFGAYAGNADRAVSAIAGWAATTDYATIRSSVTFAAGGGVGDAVMFYFNAAAPTTAHVTFDAEL